HRRIRDLDVLTAFQGLVANEHGCARISMMAREQETLPAMGRIQMRETNYLQIITSGLHRTAGPYRSTWSGDVDRRPRDGAPSCVTTHRTSPPWTCSLSRPLASICSMSSSSFGWPAKTESGSMLHLIRLRNGWHARSRRHSLGMRLRAT